MSSSSASSPVWRILLLVNPTCPFAAANRIMADMIPPRLLRRHAASWLAPSRRESPSSQFGHVLQIQAQVALVSRRPLFAALKFRALFPKKASAKKLGDARTVRFLQVHASARWQTQLACLLPLRCLLPSNHPFASREREIPVIPNRTTAISACLCTYINTYKHTYKPQGVMKISLCLFFFFICSRRRPS